MANNRDLKKFVLAALFIALSFIGSAIKIFGTIAFDSFPAFLGALLLGPWYGAGIGFLGHLFTALLSGFPLSVPVHAVIALAMAVTMAVVGLLYRLLENKISVMLNLIVVVIVGTIFNGPLSLLAMYPLLAPIMGSAGIMAMLPILTVAALGNSALAAIVYMFVRKARPL